MTQSTDKPRGSWTADEVGTASEMEANPIVKKMLLAFAERIAADENAVPYGHEFYDASGIYHFIRGALPGYAQTKIVPLFAHPPAQPAQPAQLDCPKCHGTGEVSDSDGLYVGQCTACRAIKQPAQDGECKILEVTRVNVTDKLFQAIGDKA